ncbi:hypothetical protein D3C71_1850920 [compost metagenome]
MAMNTRPSAAPGTPFNAPGPPKPDPNKEKGPVQVSGVGSVIVKPVPVMSPFSPVASVPAMPKAPSIEPSTSETGMLLDSSASRMPSLSSSRSAALATPSLSVSMGVMVATATLEAVGAVPEMACTEMVRVAVEPDVVV